MTETTGSSTDYLPYAVPAPGAPQCEADGVRNGPDGPGGTEHYWSCTAPGTVDVDGILMCDDHAGERGYGPKQEDYGYDSHAAAIRLLEEALHLRMHGERAPGGNETWREWDRKAEAFLQERYARTLPARNGHDPAGTGHDGT